MLTKDENERLTRVGSRDADGRDHAPLLAAGALVLGAAGAGWRARARAAPGRGSRGLPHDRRARSASIDEFCPHRGASLWLGRNEENGLRCVYHGWKYDVTGHASIR